jgi:hypothetical protein
MKFDDVEQLLNQIKKKNYFILSDRDKNNSFCSEYSLSSKSVKQIICNLNVFDFAKALNNCHIGYASEKLYLFAPRLELVNSNGKKEKLQLYLKINYISSCNTIVIVSLHKCDYTLKYAFK